MNNISVEYLRAFSAWLWEAAWQSMLLAVVVLAAQWMFRKQLSARWRNALWLLVLARIFLPAPPHTRFSAGQWPPPGNRAAPPELRVPLMPGFTASLETSNPLPLAPLAWMAGPQIGPFAVLPAQLPKVDTRRIRLPARSGAIGAGMAVVDVLVLGDPADPASITMDGPILSRTTFGGPSSLAPNPIDLTRGFEGARSAWANHPSKGESHSFAVLESAVNSLMRKPSDEKRKQIVQLLLEHGADRNPKR